MKPGRSWWKSYLACALAILFALGWITSSFLGLEQAQRQARAESEHQSSVRLALWRIDSWLGPLLALEAVRPYTDYLSKEVDGRFVDAPDFLLVHFQIDAEGRLTSPERAAESEGMDPVKDAALYLSTVQDIFRGREIESCMTESERARQLLPLPVPNSDPAVSVESSAASGYELSQRQGAALSLAETQNQVANSYLLDSPAGEVRVGTFLPLWFDAPLGTDPKLMYVRRVEIDGENQFQGFLCNWQTLVDGMRDQVRDLLPDCRFLPARPAGDETVSGAMLATVPVSLDALMPVVSAAHEIRPAHVILGFSWLAVLVGLLAVALAFRSTIAFAEKRSRFAAAVTHELRTPLTTFRMYTDMLAQGMVTDPRQRDEYIVTLYDESERLARLVENVMSYAQLEEGRRHSQVETVTVGCILERLAGPLVRRAESAGLTVEMDPGPCDQIRVQTDVDAVGQILFNLVDNACKYAGTNSGQPLRIRCRDRGVCLALEVVDHGAGIAADQTAMVFTPFERGSEAADRPGIGLGLALARGLARDLGGELRLLPSAGGACFELTLPK